jgi:hypothetical protein
VHLLPQAIEELTQDQLGACIEMEQALRHANPLGQQPAQGRGVGLVFPVPDYSPFSRFFRGLNDASGKPPPPLGRFPFSYP